MATTSVNSFYTELEPSRTASRATGYVPPGATQASSGVVPGATTTTTRALPANPSTPAFINDFQWVNSYLFIHKLSTPSYRYSFILWLFVVLVVLICAILHWTGSRGGFLGAAWSKWALRRRTWRKKHALAQAKREGKPFQQPFSFPSNAQMLSLVLLFIVPVVLCVLGPDYISPYTDIWDLTHNTTSNTFKARFIELDLQSRAVASTATTRSPEYTISKAWWTIGGRTGIMAFALFPLVTLFALKAPPFAVFAIPYLIQIHFDKLARLHRWTGRLIWFITTIHVATWGVQLGRDKRGTGNRIHADAPAWMFVWQYPLFIEGIIAYIALTALVILSLDSFRVRHYEAFYVLHIILVPVTLVFAALHFPTIWWWCWSALFLWAGERIHRAIRWAFVNGLLGKGKIPKGVIPVMPKQGSPRLAEKKSQLSMAAGDNKADWEMGQQRPPMANRFSSYDTYDHGTGFSIDSYADFDPPTMNNRNSTYSLRDDPHKRGSNGTAGSNAELLQQQQYPPVPQSPRSAHPLTDPRFPEGNPSPTYPPTVNGSRPHGRYSRIPPPGFALAQLLPGRVVRLRLLTPRPIVWAPGQHVLLQVPDVSKYTTHPFTVSGCYDDQSENGEGRVVELIVRAKNGFTKDLWEHVVALNNAADRPQAAYPFAEAGYGNGNDVENGYGVGDGKQQLQREKPVAKRREPGGVLLRAYVDGPFGSSIRAHWGNHASVLIVVGGTGGSFGISILEYLSLCLAGRDGQTLGGRPGGWGRKGFKTTRVRFVWLVREFSHIQWCATVIRRCLELVPSGALQVDIFVSNTEVAKNNRNSVLTDGLNGNDELLPPSARFMRRDRAGSNSSADSFVSGNSGANSMVDLSYLQQPMNSSDGLSGDLYHSNELGHEGHVLDYTNFDGEVDTKAPGEAKINKRLHKEGKIRRAKSRRSAAASNAKNELESRVRQGSHGAAGSIPPPLDLSAQDRVFPRASPRPEGVSPGPHHGLPSGASPPATHPPTSFDGRYATSAADQYRAPAPTAEPYLSPIDAAQRRWSQMSGGGPVNLRAPSPGFQNYDGNRLSVASIADMYRGYSPTPGGGDSIRGLVPDRPGSSASGPLEGEPRLDIDDQELEDIQVVAEMARPGKPRIDRILADEAGRARGAVAVACCGPASLNALVRKTVASQINPSQVLHGNMQGMITLITEEFQW